MVEKVNRISPDMLVRTPSAILSQFQLSSLKKLHLILDAKSLTHSRTSSDWSYDLIQFVGRFPELSDFYLGFEFRDSFAPSSLASKVMRPFDLDSVDCITFSRFSKLCRLLYIPKLKSLGLSMFDCTSLELAFFLLCHQGTLREIYLEGVTLVDEVGGWPWLIKEIRDKLQITNFSMQSCQETHHELFEPSTAASQHFCANSCLDNIFEATDFNGFTSIITLLKNKAK